MQSACGYIGYERVSALQDVAGGDPAAAPSTASGVGNSTQSDNATARPLLRRTVTVNGAALTDAVSNFTLLVAWDSAPELSGHDGSLFVEARELPDRQPLKNSVQHFDPASGQMQLWVLIPNLDATRDTQIEVLLREGDPAASTAEMWSDSGYQDVFHFDEVASDESLTYRNAATGNVSGTPATSHGSGLPAQIPGIVGAAQQLTDGAYIMLPSGVARAAQGTVTYWTYAAEKLNGSSSEVSYYEMSDPIPDANGFLSVLGDPGGFELHLGRGGSGTLGFWWSEDHLNSNQAGAAGPAKRLDGWELHALTWDHNGLVRLYADGVLVDSDPLTGMNNATTAPEWRAFGSPLDQSGERYYAGAVDELTYAAVERTEAWLRLHYVNLMTPEALVSLSELEAL